MFKKKHTKTFKKVDKATVLVVWPHATESYELSHWHLRSIKPLLFGLFVVSVVLAVVLSLVTANYLASHQKAEALDKEVKHLEKASSSIIEAKLDALKDSELAVNQLQSYLEERGVKAQAVDYNSSHTVTHVGGPALKIAAPIPFTGDFALQTAELLQTAEQVPLGRPSMGKLTSGFGFRKNPFGGRSSERHAGLDFKGKIGDPVASTAAGVVTHASRAGGYGNLVVVRHGFGYETRYAHLSSIQVKVGQQVQPGQLVGKLGNTGRSTGPHLHYEVRMHGNALDPKRFLELPSA